MQPLTRDATTALLRAIVRRVGPGPRFAAEEIVSRSWASATFLGARHEVAFTLTGVGAEEAATRFTQGLETDEFALRGHLVASIALVAREDVQSADGSPLVRIRIEALTVEED